MGIDRLLEMGRVWKLAPTLGAGGAVIFPHADLEVCGHQIAAAVHAILDSGAKRVLVFEDSEGDLHALDAKCTHEGCTVRYVPGEAFIWCACHSGRFDLQGRVLAGPPPRPLSRHLVQRNADGSIVVAMSKA